MKNDIFYILLFITLIISGMISLAKIPVLLLPSYEEKILSIITEYYGMEPQIIEDIITKPIESALKEVPGIKNVYSYSQKGRSKILVYLQKNEDLDKKSVLIKDSISKVSIFFPEECHQPAVYRYNIDDQPVMIFSANSKSISDKDLFSYLDHYIKPKLLAIDGVANVEIYGKAQEEYFISLNKDVLFNSNIDYKFIFQNITLNSLSVPVGKIYNENSVTQVKFPNKYDSLENLKNYDFPISEKDNTFINANDIMKIEKKEKENDRISLVNNKNFITILIYKKSNASILNISSEVRKIIKQENKIFTYSFISDQGEIFRNLLIQLKYTIIISLFLVFILSYLFFHNKLYIFLICFSIPSSILPVLSILAIFGKSLNLMNLSGIIIGIGTCVDNSIVMLENIENNLKRFNNIEEILNKSILNSYKSLLASTVTTIIVFIPFFFIGMNQQQLYQDFALSMSIILIISFFYSIFFIPSFIKRLSLNQSKEQILCLLKTNKNNLKKNKLNTKLVKKLNFLLLKLKPSLILIIFIIINLAGILAFFSISSEDISPITEKEFIAYYEFEPKYSINYRYKAMLDIGELLMKKKQNSLMYFRLDGTLCTIYFKFPLDDNKYVSKVKSLKNYIKSIKRDDGFFYFKEDKRSNEKSIQVFLFGDNLDILNEFADSCAQNIHHLKGVSSILKGYKNGGPQIIIKIKPAELYFSGLNDTDIIQFLRACFYYPVIMKFYKEKSLLDVRQEIQLNDFYLDQIEDFKIWNNKLKSAYSLNKIATIEYKEQPSMICRKDGKRFISLDIRFNQKNMEIFANEIKRIIEKEKKPIDFYYEFGEEFSNLKKNQANFIGIILLVIYLIYSTTVVILNDFKIPLVIMIFTPTIFIGALIFLKISGYGLSIPVYVASIVSIGYIVNIIILLIEEINLSKNKEFPFLILSIYKNKIKSIILTTSTTISSIFPLFFLAGSSDFFMSLSGTFFFSVLSGILLQLIFFPYIVKLKVFKSIIINKNINKS